MLGGIVVKKLISNPQRPLEVYSKEM